MTTLQGVKLILAGVPLALPLIQFQGGAAALASRIEVFNLLLELASDTELAVEIEGGQVNPERPRFQGALDRRHGLAQPA